MFQGRGHVAFRRDPAPELQLGLRLMLQAGECEDETKVSLVRESFVLLMCLLVHVSASQSDSALVL
jgi:hypothetical protein